MRVESTNGVKFLFFSDEGRACARRKMKISHSWWAFCLLFAQTKSRKKVERKNSYFFSLVKLEEILLWFFKYFECID